MAFLETLESLFQYYEYFLRGPVREKFKIINAQVVRQKKNQREREIERDRKRDIERERKINRRE